MVQIKIQDKIHANTNYSWDLIQRYEMLKDAPQGGTQGVRFRLLCIDAQRDARRYIAYIMLQSNTHYTYQINVKTE